MTLLEQARALTPPGESFSAEELEKDEVVLAWAKGELESSSAIKVLGLSSTSAIQARCGAVIRNLARAGFISIERTKKWKAY